ncbi:F-box protein PP2-B10-like [Benincasa hispida]|uniref:F-box protein PP2-B10-like n=1 Tax=Benincasa hispida TaxID=102211 RepID=UPI00190235D9|nr:F-box protein PP2-B10-like [Benincasa hispida]
MEEEEKGKATEEEISDFSSLPEGVVAKILSLTTPPDVCRSSAVCRTFVAASQSDIVWDRFLPTDWELLISRRKPSNLNFDPISSPKKETFFSLCDSPLLIDDGNKSFSLDKWSGKKCIMLGARDLSIVWSDMPVYWTWEPHPESRFAEVAVLLNVWWLEIKGKLSCKMLCPATTYAAYFVFKMSERRYYGFDIVAADAAVAIVAGECWTSRVCLDPFLDNAPPKRRRRTPCLRRNPLGNSMSRAKQPQERHDGWFEIELGELHNNGGDDEIEFFLKEVNCNYSKSGLIVQGIDIRPKISRRPA